MKLSPLSSERKGANKLNLGSNRFRSLSSLNSSLQGSLRLVETPRLDSAFEQLIKFSMR
jgi:hypothetical protein